MKYAADFRSIARNALKGKWGIAVVAGLIASLLGAIGSSGPELNVELNDGNFNASLQIFGQDVVSSNAGFEFWPVIAGIATYVAIFAVVTGIALFISALSSGPPEPIAPNSDAINPATTAMPHLPFKTLRAILLKSAAYFIISLPSSPGDLRGSYHTALG